jgi:hypothetical protein
MFRSNPGFIPHDVCVAFFRDLKDRYGRKVPIKIEERARSEEGRPIIRVAVGDGPNNHLCINEVDRNEVLCLVSAKADGERYCRDPALLKDRTVNFVFADPDGANANEGWIKRRRPDLVTFTLNTSRWLDPRYLIEWSFPIELGSHGGYQRNQPAVGTQVVMDLDAEIRAEGHYIRSVWSGQNAQFRNGVAFYASGPGREALETPLKAAANRNGIPVEYGPVEGVFDSQPRWTGFYEYPTFSALWDFCKGKVPFRLGASAYEYLSKKNPGLVGMFSEIPVFAPTRIDNSLRNLPMGEALNMKRMLIGDLPELIARTGEIAENLPADDPLVVTAQWEAGPGSSIGGGTSVPQEEGPRLLTPQEAFITVGSGAYYAAYRTMPLIRMLEAYGLVPGLRSEMSEQVYRIVRAAERLGAVKLVSITNAARLQSATVDIAQAHALGLSQNVTQGKGRGPIRKHRLPTGKPLRIGRWKRGLG